jgi:hypothetical protein
MLFTRLLSLILRTAQWVFAAIVLGLSAYFIYQRSRYHVGPLGRLIFALIWSSMSVLFAIIWAIPTKHSITGYVSDLGELLLYRSLAEEHYANTDVKSSPLAGLPSSDPSFTGSIAKTAEARGHGAQYR